MTNAEKVRHILRKYPQAKFNRGEFVICYLKEYWGVNFGITLSKLKDFLNKEWASLERALRDILKESEFKLPPEADAKRYEKENEFRKTLSKKEKKQYDFIFRNRKRSKQK